jgi:indole-3-glycerol phosphate synthase
MILDQIVAYKKKKLAEEKKNISFGAIKAQAEKELPIRNFRESIINTKGLGMIAEVKKASPSKGIIREDFDPLAIAKAYNENNVQAISVLTEDKYFLGENKYLTEIKRITSVPLLRKDFIIDSYQIYESRVLGADVILLIAAILSKGELEFFLKTAEKIGLQCLVEVHDLSELEMVLAAGAEIIGINNRNLKTFETDIRTTENLIQHIPNHKIVISESGINTAKDMKYLESLGVKGVLIGESFMRAASIEEKLKELRGYSLD